MNPKTKPVIASIFLAEDEALIAMELAARLNSLGYAVCGTAARGEDLLRDILKTQTDLILMDINLAGELDGIDTASRLRQNHDLPVVFLTAYSDPNLLERAKQASPFGFLVKPYNESELNATIQIALHKHRSEAALRLSIDSLEQQVRERTEQLEQRVLERTRELDSLNKRLRLDEFSINHASIGTLWISKTGQILRSNKASHKLLGYTEEELLTMRFNELAPTLTPEAWDQHWQSLKSRQQLHLDLELRHRNNSRVWVEADANHLEFEGEEYNFIFLRDSSARRAAERQALASQRLESLSTLAAGIAHDLNNTFVPILLAVDLLRDRDDQYEDHLNLIENGANQGTQMVQKLLGFAKGKTGEKISIDAQQMTQSILRVAQTTFPKTIRIEGSCAKNCPPLHGNPAQVHQAVLNLCTNGTEAMPKGGTLRISVERVDVQEATIGLEGTIDPGPYVRIQVADSGAGVPPENIDRIFEPFFTTKAENTGYGLGLSTVIGIAKGHRGFARVRSELGRGSTFEIYFPADLKSHAAEPADEKPLFDGRGQWVLVVDDEAHVRNSLQPSLERMGLQVATATDGSDALVTFGRSHQEIALVLTDIHMSPISGITLIRSMRRINPKLRIIAMTGMNESNADQELTELHVEARLQKPFNLATLAAALTTALPS
ncbi:MAG: response regulator [Verrucomicrobia bacterium]|nr:response regulator [Verrucomicrobiota bacterium]